MAEIRRSPVEVGSLSIPLFTGFYTFQVVIAGFCSINSIIPVGIEKTQMCRPIHPTPRQTESKQLVTSKQLSKSTGFLLVFFLSCCCNLIHLMKKLFEFKQISLNQVTGVSSPGWRSSGFLEIAQQYGRIKPWSKSQRKSVDIWICKTYTTCLAYPDEDCSCEEMYVPVIIY